MGYQLLPYFNPSSGLSPEKADINAYCIYDYMRNVMHWSPNAICGILANMYYESSCNPARHEVNGSGYGLVQWTPSSKFTNWANKYGYPINTMEPQLLRIKYEFENGLQYGSSPLFQISARDFMYSSNTPEFLAGAFLCHYEKPASYRDRHKYPEAFKRSLTKRQTKARYYYNKFNGATPPPPPPVEPEEPPTFPTDPTNPTIPPVVPSKAWDFMDIMLYKSKRKR